ncbi:MAG: SMP-30/gluconolactonase/LRE family protein, partial [Planctomycetota bacterium]
DGSIYFTDIPNNAIHRYDPATGETTLFTDDSGGANGLMFWQSHLWACAGDVGAVHCYPGRTDRHFTVNEEGQTVLVAEDWRGLNGNTFEPLFSFDKFEGKRFNKPNDIVSSAHGFYFTDPVYGREFEMVQPSEAVYMLRLVDPDDQDFIVLRLIDDLVRPNGIGLSPDEQALYVNDNGDKKIWAYPIPEPGSVGEGRLLNDLADLGGPDGMTVGPRGRIYTTIYGKGVLILSPEGERLGFIETGPQTTNCAFGADGKTLYVTAEKSLKRIVLNTGVDAE